MGYAAWEMRGCMLEWGDRQQNRTQEKPLATRPACLVPLLAPLVPLLASLLLLPSPLPSSLTSALDTASFTPSTLTPFHPPRDCQPLPPPLTPACMT